LRWKATGCGDLRMILLMIDDYWWWLMIIDDYCSGWFMIIDDDWMVILIGLSQSKWWFRGDLTMIKPVHMFRGDLALCPNSA
jgi:hypothetical protein